MANKTVLEIDLTVEARHQIERLARRRGFDAPGDYLLALAELDAKAQDEPAEAEEDLVTRFRRSWQDAMAGKTYPVATLWDGLEDE